MSTSLAADTPPPRDYSHSDYAPHDPLCVVYDWETKTFSYKRRSLIPKNTYSTPIPRATKEVQITPIDIRGEHGFWKIRGRLVTLPMRVYWARKWMGEFKTLYVEGKID
ncbi:hypothetical protein BDZ45DRAFT_680561 [Acephala macrosclerotiorum]|nr:hypothetical protein BDZ45DRAFT_680561 [Acephala macrosclerotiorum]